jgi:hypothetical protein
MNSEMDPGYAANELSAELECERRWQNTFARSADLLEKLADEALADYHAGNTEPLAPERL